MGRVFGRWFSRDKADDSASAAEKAAGVETLLAEHPGGDATPDSAPAASTASATPNQATPPSLEEFLIQNFLQVGAPADAVAPAVAAATPATAVTLPPAAPSISVSTETEAIEGVSAGANAPEAEMKGKRPKTSRPPAREQSAYDKGDAHVRAPAFEPASVARPVAADSTATKTADVSATDEDFAPAQAASQDFPVNHFASPDVLAGEPGARLPERPLTPTHPHVDPLEWKLEEALGSHREWVESLGMSGRKANLASSNLEGAELIGVNLRYADLQDSNLKATDLLLADLRDACLVRANLEEACLVGANLEGANLEGASLDSSMGLVARQLAGANLRDASLPATIRDFPAMSQFLRASVTVSRYFTALLVASMASWLIVWKTKDMQLLTDSAVVPFLHSAAASAALPTAEIYLIAPVMLAILYMVFHYHLQRLWESVLELPAVFPNGRELGETGPRIVIGLARAHFRWMDQDSSSTGFIEKAASVLLGYWIVPATLLLFWGRYLTLQEIHGTLLHEFLAIGATGAAVLSITRIGRAQERWIVRGKGKRNLFANFKRRLATYVTVLLFLALTFLSVGTVRGVPHDRARAPQFGVADIRRWAPTVFWAIGYDPFADLTEAAMSLKPDGWNGSDDQLPQVRGSRMNGTKFRYAQAYGIFLANAHLWRTDFQGAFMSQADMRNADLGQSSLRYAILDGALMHKANLDRANLEGANLSRVDLREANLSYVSLEKATLVDARLDGASLYGAKLSNATLIRASFEKADLREAVLAGADLTHAHMQQTYLWSAKLPGARLQNAELSGAIFIDAFLRDADLRGAQFNGTVMTGANIEGAMLDYADLRGALGLTPSQVCSAKSRSGAALDATLETQVQALCGAVK
jgi:uncharacterized protein YjbI with pentapeptide repeats